MVPLVQRAQSGDEQAFADLFEQYHAAVLNYAYQILGDGPSAEDVTQDAFVVAHQRLPQLGPPYDFRSWVFRIAGNLAIDQIRRDRRLVDLEDADLMAEPPTTRRPPEKHLRRQEQQRQIRLSLDRLPSNYRQALVLREVYELSYDELARALECSYEGARQLVHRARMRFRDAHGLRLTLAGGAGRCAELGDLLSAYQDGELSGEAEARARRHIATCPQCRETQEDMRTIGTLLAGLTPWIPSPGWSQQVLQNVRQGGGPGHGAAKVRAKLAERPVSRGEQVLGQPDEVPSLAEGSSAGSGGAPGAGWLGGLGSGVGRLMFGAAALVGLTGMLFFGLRARQYIAGAAPSLEPTPVPLASPVPSGEATRPMAITPVPNASLTPPTQPATSTMPPTLTPSPGPLTGTATQNANCRLGPGTMYRNVATLMQGQAALLEGRNADATWLWIATPGGSGHCWVWAGSLSLSGPTAGLSVIAAPPTDTPSPTPGDTQPPSIALTYAPTGSGRPTDHDKITLTARASDPSGVARIEIWYQAPKAPQPALVRTCLGAVSCFFSGGPYPVGTARAFARAWDISENEGESPTITFVIYAYLQ